MAVKTPPAVQPAPAAPSALRRVLVDYRYPLAVFAASRIGVYLLFAIVGWTHRRPRYSGLTYRALFAPLDRWDAVWYHWVVRHGYDPSIAHGNVAAFYPPVAARLAHGGRGCRYPSTSPGACSRPRSSAPPCACSTGSRWAATTRRWPAGRSSSSPSGRSAFVFSMPYSESLFLLTSLAAFALTWHGRWWSGSAAGALAVLARPVGIALIPGVRLAHLPRAGLAMAGVPAAAPDGRRRAGVLRSTWAGAPATAWATSMPSTAAGGGGSCRCRSRSAGRCGTTCIQNGLLRSLADVSFTLALVLALVPGLAGAAAARRVPDLRRAGRPAAVERRLAALDGPDGHGRASRCSGRWPSGPADERVDTAGQDALAGAAGDADVPRVRHPHIRALIGDQRRLWKTRKRPSSGGVGGSRWTARSVGSARSAATVRGEVVLRSMTT